MIYAMWSSLHLVSQRFRHDLVRSWISITESKCFGVPKQGSSPLFSTTRQKQLHGNYSNKTCLLQTIILGLLVTLVPTLWTISWLSNYPLLGKEVWSKELSSSDSTNILYLVWYWLTFLHETPLLLHSQIKTSNSTVRLTISFLMINTN